MSELLKKTILAGLGALSLTREKAEEIARDLIKRGEMSDSREAAFIRELLEEAEKNKAGLEEKIEKVVEKTLARLNLATRKEVDALKEEIEKLSGKKKQTKK